MSVGDWTAVLTLISLAGALAWLLGWAYTRNIKPLMRVEPDPTEKKPINLERARQERDAVLYARGLHPRFNRRLPSHRTAQMTTRVVSTRNMPPKQEEPPPRKREDDSDALSGVLTGYVIGSMLNADRTYKPEPEPLSGGGGESGGGGATESWDPPSTSEPEPSPTYESSTESKTDE